METHNLSKLIGRSAELAPIPLTGRYPQRLLNREVVKSGLGLALTLGVVVLLNPSAWVSVPLLVVAALFALYLIQQAARYPLRFTVDDAGVTRVRGAERKAFRWSELKQFRLNYYPNGRKASMGTLVLVLHDGAGKLKVDSTLDHFPTLLSRAAQAARERNLELRPTTEANLDQLGL